MSRGLSPAVAAPAHKTRAVKIAPAASGPGSFNTIEVLGRVLTALNTRHLGVAAAGAVKTNFAACHPHPDDQFIRNLFPRLSIREIASSSKTDRREQSVRYEEQVEGSTPWVFR